MGKKLDKSLGAGVQGPVQQVDSLNATGSLNRSKMDSDYNSVAQQTGIYAGKDGFDIQVGKNTDLKGAVIASDATPDKNKLSTGTLTYSDIQNKADYNAGSIGVSYANGKNVEIKNKGLTPNIGVTASGDASSTTKSAVANGTVEVRSNPSQDLSGLSRDTTNSLNALGKIFDKKTVQEQQELANLFGEEAYKAIGELANSQLKKAANDANTAIKNHDQIAYDDAMQRKALWDEGGTNKIALHALVGGIMSDLGGSSFTSGALGAGVNQAVQKELSKLKDKPDVWQWASAVVGAAAVKAVGGDATSGASVAVSGTKNNELSDIILHPITVSEGFMDGVKNAGIETAEAFTEIIAHPIDTIKGLKDLVADIYNDPTLVQKIGVDTLAGIQQRLDTIANGSAYETGEGLGRLTVDIGSMFVDVGLAAKLIDKVPAFSRAVEALSDMRAAERAVQEAAIAEKVAREAKAAEEAALAAREAKAAEEAALAAREAKAAEEAKAAQKAGDVAKTTQGSSNAGGNFAGKINTADIPNMSKNELIEKLPSDWKVTENNGFVHVRDAEGNIRMRIDPPDKVTNYDHVHLYDETGKPLDVNLNIVDRKSPDAHIPIEK